MNRKLKKLMLKESFKALLSEDNALDQIGNALKNKDPQAMNKEYNDAQRLKQINAQRIKQKQPPLTQLPEDFVQESLIIYILKENLQLKKYLNKNLI